MWGASESYVMAQFDTLLIANGFVSGSTHYVDHYRNVFYFGAQ